MTDELDQLWMILAIGFDRQVVSVLGFSLDEETAYEIAISCGPSYYATLALETAIESPSVVLQDLGKWLQDNGVPGDPSRAAWLIFRTMTKLADQIDVYEQRLTPPIAIDTRAAISIDIPG